MLGVNFANSMHASALRSLVAAVALCFSFFASGADETGAAVAKPQVKVGDRWSYRRTNYLTNVVVGSTTDMRVVSTGPDEIMVVSKRRDRDNETDNFYTSEWNAIVLGTMTLIPYADFFKFPLKVGTSHETSYETAFKNSEARAKFEQTVKVVGWEDINVPAGKFRALKVEVKGTYARLDGARVWGGTGWARFEWWYVPEVKRWVKYTYWEGYRGPTTPYQYYGDELVEFSDETETQQKEKCNPAKLANPFSDPLPEGCKK